MTRAKIAEIKSVRAINGTNGQFWSFTVVMDNNDKGQVNRNSEDALKVGSELTYELDTSGQYVKLKENRPRTFGGKGTSVRQSTASIALSLAKDVLCANIAVSGKAFPMDAALGQKMTALATELNAWLVSNDK